MLILDTHLAAADPWHAESARRLNDGTAEAAAHAPHAPRPYQLLTLAQWRDARDGSLVEPLTAQPAGAALANTEDPTELAETLGSHLHQLALITLEFPKFADGRAYSQARLLRSRARYTGPLRATGHVIADMLPLLQRCGFDEVLLSPGQTLAAAQRALTFFGAHYQGDARQPQPLFRRGASEAAAR